MHLYCRCSVGCLPEIHRYSGRGQVAFKPVHFSALCSTFVFVVEFGLVTSPDEKPLIIGYGDGDFCSHGRGGVDTSVPTKALFKAVQLAFKKKGVKGGVLKVWEHATTAKCHRCHNTLEKVYKTVNDNMVEDYNFRRCTHCVYEQRPKLRSRDWNAALNIRVVVMSILRGEDRPEYLNPDRTGRRRARVVR